MQLIVDVRWRIQDHRRRNQGCVSAAPFLSRLVDGKDINDLYFPELFLENRRAARTKTRPTSARVPCLTLSFTICRIPGRSGRIRRSPTTIGPPRVTNGTSPSGSSSERRSSSGGIFVYGPGDRKQASRFSRLRLRGRAVAHQVADPVRLPPLIEIVVRTTLKPARNC